MKDKEMNTINETMEEIPYIGYECECKNRKSVTHWSEDIEPCFRCEQMRYFSEIECEISNMCNRMVNIGYNIGVEISDELDQMFELMEDIKFKIKG